MSRLSIFFIIFGVGVIVSTFAFKGYQQKNSNTVNAPFLSHRTCDSPFKFDISPLSVEHLEYITPMGRTMDSHVTPTDHQYWTPKGVSYDRNQDDQVVYDIYSPADGVINHLEHHSEVYGDQYHPKIDDWRLVIQHDCGVSTIFIHIDMLTDTIMSQIGSPNGFQSGTTNYRVSIPLKKGQIIGRQKRRSFDFSVHNDNVVLQGFVNPRRYEQESWKIHTVDPFDYFNEPIRSQLIAKTPRKIPPIGGKIDYDIDGRLVGNWFKKGSDYDSKYFGRLWDSEMSVTYNHFDPKYIVITIGDYNGKSATFSVRGNAPDPKDVGVGQLIKYEFVNFDYLDDGKRWQGRTYPHITLVQDNNSVGTGLFRLEDNRILKVEFFPNKKATEVSGFGSNAIMYER